MLLKLVKYFQKLKNQYNKKYLSKFNIYCILSDGRNEEAQLILDLKIELGFKDDYFEKKMNYLFGYTNKIDETISEKNILDFHLAHRIIQNFHLIQKKIQIN